MSIAAENGLEYIRYKADYPVVALAIKGTKDLSEDCEDYVKSARAHAGIAHAISAADVDL